MSETARSDDKSDQTNRALLVLFFMPMLFVTNIIFGRLAVTDIEPFTLAFIRWGTTALLLAPFVVNTLRREFQSIIALKLPLLFMGFLGMWICGALVYLALKYTSATNGTLIYASAPVLVILIERFFRGRIISTKEIMGIILAIVGIVTIVCKGDLANLLNLDFNWGDLLFVLTAISWAIYSVMLKFRRFDHLQTMPLFALLAGSGAILLAPFAAYELVYLPLPQMPITWLYVAGIVVISSLLAFSAFQYGVHIVGSSTATIFLYLLPVYGVAMAVGFLGEEIFAFHLWGIAMVLGGVILATLKFSRK